MPELRMLTDSGLTRFRQYLADLREGHTAPPPDLLEDENTSAPVGVVAAVEKQSFNSRLEAGRYMATNLDGPVGAVVAKEPRVWAWLSLYYFDVVCPADENGRRRPGEDYRHIPSDNYRHYYRHLLLGAWQIYRLHGDGAHLLLSGPVNAPGDWNEQVASRQELIVSQGILSALNALYFDTATNAPKRGAASVGKKGGLRRFIRVLQQFDLTYDIQSMSCEEIISLLPDEFAEWHGN